MASTPVITEEHQKKLEAFIAEIKLDGSEIRSGTPEMKSPVDATKLNDPEFKAKFKTDQLFKKYTGWEHWALVNKWLTDKQTTCNEFVTKCAVAMGCKETIGRFDVADLLSQRGLNHCWVPASSGATPAYGDVYRLLGDVDAKDHNKVRLNHMAVSLHVDGTTWHTVEGGQAGPSSGYDVVRRRTRTWKPHELQGWVNMKALLNADKPLPYWLGGWWRIEEDPFDVYFYHFGANGKVTCSMMQPPSPMALPPAEATVVGSFVQKGFSDVIISWNSADADETLTFFANQDARKYSIAGKTSHGKKLTGKRIMLAGRFDGGNK